MTARAMKGWEAVKRREEAEGGSFWEEMETCRSVRIIHDILHRLDFIYLVELFRFFGVLVCEDILTEAEKTAAEEHTDYDAVIYVGRKEITERQAGALRITKEKYRNLVDEVRAEADLIWFCDCLDETGKNAEKGERLQEGGIYPGPIDRYLDEEQQAELYCSVLGKVLEKSGKADKGFVPDDCWKELVRVCVRNRLIFHSMNLQYYPKLPSEAAKRAKAAFIEAYEQLDALEGVSGEVIMHYRYARLWCAVKANLACDFQNGISYFPIDELAEECRQLCRDYEDFDNAKVLLGLCYEPSKSSGNQALMAFDSALDGMGSVCFTSTVYYWMGKRFESFQKNEDAENCYKNANNRKEKFRNYFKLAIFERDRKEYRKSLELFHKILSKLERKLEMDFADPLELEYAFKVCTQECYIYYHMGDYGNAIKMGERAIEVRKGKIESNQFFPVFYGKDAAEYKKILEKRLRLESAYRILLEIYAELGEKEKKEEYRALLNGLETE